MWELKRCWIDNKKGKIIYVFDCVFMLFVFLIDWNVFFFYFKEIIDYIIDEIIKEELCRLIILLLNMCDMDERDWISLELFFELIDECSGDEEMVVSLKMI